MTNKNSRKIIMPYVGLVQDTLSIVIWLWSIYSSNSVFIRIFCIFFILIHMVSIRIKIKNMQKIRMKRNEDMIAEIMES